MHSNLFLPALTQGTVCAYGKFNIMKQVTNCSLLLLYRVVDYLERQSEVSLVKKKNKKTSINMFIQHIMINIVSRIKEYSTT